MSARRFERLLLDTIGLDTASIGQVAVGRAVAERQRACGMADPEAYWSRVSTSARELQALVDAVVVPETWFFRDPDAFAALARVAAQRLSVGHPVVRVLSVPSSTGEEPYSIAMTLLDAGIPRERFQIDAVDVSTHALARAKCALYGKGSFRGTDLRFRSRYFIASPAGHMLVEPVRRLVRFLQGNLLAPAFLDQAAFDVIFCRNLLIYFDRDTQRRAANVLASLLTADGVLFVAAAEAAAVSGTPQLTMSGSAPAAFTRAPATAAQRPRGARPRRAADPVPVVSAPPAAIQQAPAESCLVEAQRLADQGQFAAAARRCEEHLDRHGPSPEVFHLLGLVSDADGRGDAAATYYRKALYLDPNHEPSLVHLALLMAAAQNDAEAERLRSRARRVTATGGA